MEENIIFCLSIFTIVLMVIKSNLFAQTDKHSKADIEFDKRNYKEAIKLYQDSLKDEINSNEINSIKYKLALCYFYLYDNKNFYTLIADIRKHNKDNIWEAKSFYLEGIKSDDYNNSKAIQLLEKARALYLKYVNSSEITEEDIIELDMVLIKCFNQRCWWSDEENTDDIEEEKRIEEESLLEETNSFSPDWKTRKKIIYLFRRLLSYQKDNTYNYYKFVYDYANFFRRNARTEIYKNEYKRHFDDIINNSNDNNLIASSYYVLGNNCEDDLEFTEAIDYFNILIEKYPESEWINAAKWCIYSIKEPELDVKMKTQFYLNENITVNIISKNIKNINYKVYEIDLISFYKDKMSKKNFMNRMPSQYFSNIKNSKKYIIKEHLNCDINTSTKDDYKECTDIVEIVDKNIFNKVGQYLFVASSEGMTVTSIFFVTDLILINRTEDNKIHSWVVNSENGKPMGDVSVLSRVYNNSEDDILITGNTNDKGLCSIYIVNSHFKVKSTIAYKGKSFASTYNNYRSYVIR